MEIPHSLAFGLGIERRVILTMDYSVVMSLIILVILLLCMGNKKDPR